MGVNSDTSSFNLYWLLLQAIFRTKPGLLKLAERHDLTVVQVYTLCSLKPGESIPMHTISSVLICDASNVTGIVDRLLVHGLISREEKPEDRRVKMISLTNKGEALRKTLFDELKEYELPEFAQLTDAEKTQLQAILVKII